MLSDKLNKSKAAKMSINPAYMHFTLVSNDILQIQPVFFKVSFIEILFNLHADRDL